MDAAVRELVRRRAGDRCEYCRLRQEDLPFATFQMEHIIPRQHNGSDDPSNLALACERCNSHKGTNFAGIDSETNVVTVLFNPRRHSWEEHFRQSGAWIIGRTAIGRTTAQVLNMNEERRLRLRALLLRHG
jgi:hypothetical protein